MSLPYIDPHVKYMGAAKLRKIGVDELTALNASEDIVVVQDRDTPLAVIMGYAAFLTIQAADNKELLK